MSSGPPMSAYSHDHGKKGPGGGSSGSSGPGGGSPCEKGRRGSAGTILRRQCAAPGSFHSHSAGVADQLTPLQVHRQKWEPNLPHVLRSPVKGSEDKTICASNPLTNKYATDKDRVTLAGLFPHTWNQGFVRLVPSGDPSVWLKHQPLRIGVVLSGGQAPGGHNVISGIYDYAKQCNPNSQVFGFLGGPHGIFSHQYVEIGDEFMNRFRNQGGFDMIRSGRHKIETPEQKEMTKQICEKLDLHGLIIVGGDDSNTNAAIIAEYFKAQKCNTKVIGCPKTIDGDLRNEYVEASFGFDTAVKTYSEFVGNLCQDVGTSGRYYHFIRVMGRSASHIALECALQTRPNLVFIGEEVQAKKLTLKQIVNDVVELVVKRHEAGRDFGVILLPEGLIEFIPEMGTLISEINSLMAKANMTMGEITCKLSPVSRGVFEMMPHSIKNQLLLDRDPHGNVQVAMIATERLLILMTEAELQKRGHTSDLADMFSPQSHYFGYEGRCGMPSVFDANYCYALGHAASALIDNGCTGCMAVMKGLEKRAEEWLPGGCPLTLMMTIEERKGKHVPVIKKYLVELDKPTFQNFAKVREEWKYRDLYRSPGPIQFEGPVAPITNFSITQPSQADLLPARPVEYEQLQKRHHFAVSFAQMSLLQRQRLEAQVPLNSVFLNHNCRVMPATKIEIKDQIVHRSVLRAFPLQAQLSKNTLYCIRVPSPDDHSRSPISGCSKLSAATQQQHMEGNVSPSVGSVAAKQGKGLIVGVVLTGQQAPGVANVVVGLYERITMHGGRVLGFKGARGVLNNDYIELTSSDVDIMRNQGGLNVLGRTADVEAQMASEKGIAKVKHVCTELDLDGLVMIGGCWTLSDVAIVSEAFLLSGLKTRVVGVPCTQNNNIDSRFFETTIGFDSASKCYSQLIGNLLTDAASATKYWYFVRLMGRDKSQMAVEVALQTHSNSTLVSEVLSAGDRTLQDVVVETADVICARAESGKNFGAVLIPEGLISELPQMRQLLTELTSVISDVSNSERVAMMDELVYVKHKTNKYSSKLTSWSWSLLMSLPEFIRKQLIQPRSIGRLQISKIASEEMLSQMVTAELANRKKLGTYSGAFSPVCFYFGYQARSSMPSQFDSALGLSNGYLSGICVEGGLTGYVTSMRGLCGSYQSWRPTAVPVTAMLRIPPPDEMYASKTPMVLADMVKINGKALMQLQNASHMWEQEDRFCNPGPLQFFGDAMLYYTRYLYEQQHDYISMLEQVDETLANLQSVCTFGVDELSLKTTYNTLEMLNRLLQSIRASDERGAYSTSFAGGRVRGSPAYSPLGDTTADQVGYLKQMSLQNPQLGEKITSQEHSKRVHQENK